MTGGVISNERFEDLGHTYRDDNVLVRFMKCFLLIIHLSSFTTIQRYT